MWSEKCVGLKHVSLIEKRSLSIDEQRNLQKCLRVPGISEEHVRQVWNIAGEIREGAVDASKRQLYNVVRQRFGSSASCFHEKPVDANDGTRTGLIVIDLPAALQTLVDKCPAWASALKEAHALHGGVLTAVIYHDEITCGNVLSVIKRKKVTALYLCFKELLTHMHLEHAWIPGMVFQKIFSDHLRGGLSAALKVLVKSMSEIGNFHIQIDGASVSFQLAGRSHLLSDHDAQRATYLSKGSAALKPCLFCSNVCKKDALPHSDVFYDIDSAEWNNFVPLKDTHWAFAVERLDACRTKKETNALEQTFGVNRQPDGIMWDNAARWALSPTMALNDSLHCYYCNGVASCELSAYMECSEARGWMRQKYLDEALKDQWQQHGKTILASASKIRRILQEKMFEGDVYKGDAHDTSALVFLLAYYATHLRDAVANFADICDSFLALKHCCKEMYKAYACQRRLEVEENVRPWRDAQINHQKIFRRVHDKKFLKPKHHHRLHLPSHALLLGCVPNCSTQEKKHQLLKSGGLVDRQAGKLSEYVHLQRSLLKRLLEAVADQSNEFGLNKWNLDAPKEAPQTFRDKFAAADLRTSQSATLGKVTVYANEVLFCDSATVLIHGCFHCSSMGLFFEISQLQNINKYMWGSSWKLLPMPRQIMLAKQNRRYTTPMWQRNIPGEIIQCLH